MRLIPAAALVLAVAACRNDPYAIEPPVVAQPEDGSTVDRCLVRVRTDAPTDGWDPGFGDAVESGRAAHVNWRTGAGVVTEVTNASFDAHPDVPYLFSVVLAPGSNTLEVGRCDEVDYCAWLPLSVTVAPRAGSPDCAFARGGSAVLHDSLEARRVFPHPDGSHLVHVAGGGWEKTGLVKLRADGTVDKTFAGDGLAQPAEYVAGVLAAPRPGGGWVIVTSQGNNVQYILQVDAAGTTDVAFGTGGSDGVRPLPTGTATAFSARALRRLDDGTLLLAGFATRGEPASASAMLLRLDASANVIDERTIGTRPEDPGEGTRFSDVTIDPDGKAYWLEGRSVYAGDLAADDTSFGTGGVWTVPEGDGVPVGFASGGGAFAVGLRLPHPDGSARGRVRIVEGATSTLVELDAPIHDGFVSDLVLHLARSPSGDTYVGFAVHKLPTTTWGSIVPPPSGAWFAVLRIRNGAPDLSFGEAGIARVGFDDARTPVAVEATTDVPLFLTLDGDGVLLAGRTVAPVGWGAPARGAQAAAITRLRP